MPVCAICGKMVDEVTDDHIPLKGLFGNDPGELITVPSCLPCNQDSSKDDEYFRLLASEVRAAQHAEAKPANEAVIRSMRRPQAFRFRRMLQNSMVPTVSQSGLVAEASMWAVFDLSRWERTVDKVVRGLFYKLRGFPVPPGCRVLRALLETYLARSAHPEFAEFIGGYVVPRLLEREAVDVGRGVFVYRTLWDDDDPNTVFFLIDFYARWRFIGGVLPPVTPAGSSAQ